MAYRCSTCGYRSPKWMGFCPQCRAGDGLVAEAGEAVRRPERARVVSVGDAEEGSEERLEVGLEEVDRVLGGGLVPGSCLLLGGEPGVGKSTLLLQVAGALASRGGRALVASAEESVQQVASRARRLGVSGEGVYLAAEGDVDAVLAAAEDLKPDLLAIDSVQAVSAAEIGGAAGGTAQVRECAARVIRFAKERHLSAVLVGHVTKDGGIAGPKLLEHMVDVVLYLEGESEAGLRILRGLKNRYGPTHQVGVFEMRDAGLREVGDPSSVLVGEWSGSVPGTVVFPAIEGRRPVLVEVQALVSRSLAPPARRSVKGLEPARLHQLLAVLERHAGLRFSDMDVYVSVVGGVRLREPASDLPVALALASSLLHCPLGTTAAWGEVGLTGEVRPAAHRARRHEEARRIGVSSVVAPEKGRGLRLDEALEQALGAADGYRRKAL